MLTHTEMVEHDTAPEERETVVEEPHKKEKEDGSEAKSKAGESEAAPLESDKDTDVSYATGVSSFFTGFASMMQTTVS